MRKIGLSEIEDIALGASLLGAGGGGDPYVGKLVAIGAVRECGPVTLLEPDEVPDDALVMPIAMMGAPTILGEKTIGEHEYQNLYEMVSKFFGRQVYAFMPMEAGGVNSMLPIAAAARLGLPLVDADGMGRAFPELQMVTFTMGGVSATPMALVDEKGVSGKSPEEAFLEYAQGYRLFKGKIVDVLRETKGAFNYGKVVLEGIGNDKGHQARIVFQNENLCAQVDDRIVATVPDLICLVDAETFIPVTTDALKYGKRVLAVGLKCFEMWRSEAGLELVGPRYFGLDTDYIPLEERANGGEADV